MMTEVPKFAVTVPKELIKEVSWENTPLTVDEITRDPRVYFADAGNKYAFQLSFFAANEVVRRIPQSKIVTKRTSWLKSSPLI